MDILNEKIEGLVKKAEKSGMPYSILKKVYDRGMAAWRTGHRPGTTPQQWAFARVNSFVTKSSGTWGKADKDLAKQVRGEEVEKRKNAKEMIGQVSSLTTSSSLESRYAAIAIFCIFLSDFPLNCGAFDFLKSFT